MRIHFYENSLNYLPLFLFLSCICHTAIFRNFSLSSSNIVWFFSRRRFYYSKAYPLESVTDHKPWIRDLIWQIRFFFPIIPVAKPRRIKKEKKKKKLLAGDSRKVGNMCVTCFAIVFRPSALRILLLFPQCPPAQGCHQRWKLTIVKSWNN